MYALFRRSGQLLPIIVTSVFTLLWGCGPARYAYFQPQQYDTQRTLPGPNELIELTDTIIPQQASAPAVTLPATNGPAPVLARLPVRPSARAQASDPVRHPNPDSRQSQRFRRLFGSIPVAHVAPRTQVIDRHSRSRKVYGMALIALGIAVLSVSSLFVAGVGTIGWIMAVTLPLTATLLGVSSLTTINRNPDRYRGKGWAIAAILLGTGILGLALIALAALSASELVKH